MMKRAVYVVVMICLAAGLLSFAASRNQSLLQMRRRDSLDAAEPLENAPPVLAFTTVVLGGFRGLIADMLWLRLSRLQQEHEYFEMMQLSEWITKLEPRCTEIWAFHAWNMAYNISIMMPRPEERWRWVLHGIELLRDEGLRYNPGDPMIYSELGWMFQHKIGGTSDRLNGYYKKQWARRMQDLLGGGYPDYHTLAEDGETARRLREEYRLSPEIMKRVDAEYGPLDWRLPETHAVYWAFRGENQAGARGCPFCERMMYQCMMQLFFTGRLEATATGGVATRKPAPALLAGVERAVRLARQHDDTGVETAYFNFLSHAVPELYSIGHVEEAHRVFEILKTQFGVDRDFKAFVREGGSSK